MTPPSPLSRAKRVSMGCFGGSTVGRPLIGPRWCFACSARVVRAAGAVPLTAGRIEFRGSKMRASIAAAILLAVSTCALGGGQYLQFDGDDSVVVPDAPSLNPSHITLVFIHF